MVPSDFKELLSVFNSHNVRYLLVSGYAVSLHAQPRTTKDLDLWVSPDPATPKQFSPPSPSSSLTRDA